MLTLLEGRVRVPDLWRGYRVLSCDPHPDFANNYELIMTDGDHVAFQLISNVCLERAYNPQPFIISALNRCADLLDQQRRKRTKT